MTKFKAFAIHLGISLIIFLIILSIIVFYWYPPPFFSTDGGWQGIRIIAAVDLVLGPLLTLIVYKKGKPKLKMDLTIIGFIQAGALAWGIWVVHHERPVAAVFTENRFSTVVSYQLSDAVTEKELKSYGDRTPVWIYSDLPEDINELQQLRIRALQSGKSLARFHEYYRPIGEKEKSSILASSFDLQEWTADKQKDKKVFDAFQKKYADILVCTTRQKNHSATQRRPVKYRFAGHRTTNSNKGKNTNT